MIDDMKAPDQLSSKLAEQVPAMLSYWDKNQICRFANKAYLEWFGRTPDEMINKMTLHDLLGPIYPLNEPHIIGVLEGKSQTFEREIKSPMGVIRYALINYHPDKVDNEIIGFHTYVTDISVLKISEKKLVKSNQVYLNQNQMLLNFSNAITHNLKSYSDGLSSIVEVLKEENLKEEEKVKLLGFLFRLSDRFSETISHLNEIVATQNQASLTYEMLYLHNYADKTTQVLQIQMSVKETVILNKIPINTALFANPAYIESILHNILSNAIKYSYPNRTPIIEINCIQENNTLILSVKDNGIGIDLKKHGKDLFGMYKTFSTNKDAKGIGLFITKYQVEVMGGEINVESQLNEGTTVTIKFPVTN
jgi:PAS domain S-box-containing protein